mmetsp:Transcript_13439/g.50345  ORF Transcript_13439/g.50345 Transcript_13439/m.50345 type:complete len:533 (-) Transcript_13439:71-1669(-)
MLSSLKLCTVKSSASCTDAASPFLSSIVPRCPFLGPKSTATRPPRLGSAVSSARCGTPVSTSPDSFISSTHSVGVRTSTTVPFFRYSRPPSNDLLTIRTRVLFRSHAGSSRGSRLRFSPGTPDAPAFWWRFSPPAAPAPLVRVDDLSTSTSSLHRTVMVSPLDASSICARSDLPSSFKIRNTRPASPACRPSLTFMRFPSRGPGASFRTSFSSKDRTFRDLPSGPSAKTITEGASRVSPGFMCFLLFVGGGAPVAPSPSRPPRGTNSTAETNPVAFRPTGLPSSHPIPRSIAAPKSSIGIDAYSSSVACSGRSSTSSLNACSSFSARDLPMKESSGFAVVARGRCWPSFGAIFVKPYATSPACAVSPFPPIRSAVSNLSSSFTTSSAVGTNEGAFRRRPVPTSNVLSCGAMVFADTDGCLSFSSSPEPETPVRYSIRGGSPSSSSSLSPPRAGTPTTTLFFFFFHSIFPSPPALSGNARDSNQPPCRKRVPPGASTLPTEHPAPAHHVGFALQSDPVCPGSIRVVDSVVVVQ